MQSIWSLSVVHTSPQIPHRHTWWIYNIYACAASQGTQLQGFYYCCFAFGREGAHTEMHGWPTPHIYTLRASVKTAHVSLQKLPTQLVCEDSHQSWIVFLPCSHHWSHSPAHCHTLCLLPLLEGSLSTHTPNLPRPTHCFPLREDSCSLSTMLSQQRRWSPSESPPLAPQSHSGLVRWSPWQRWHWWEERWDRRKRSSGTLFQYIFDKMTLTFCLDNLIVACFRQFSSDTDQ